jgi:hypothetical protein
MEEALSFFRAFEVWIYLLLGLGGLIYIRRFILSWQELREAGFGLERERAQSRLNQSASVLVLLLTMAVAEFVLVSFIAPSVPGATPLLTPTLDLLATPTYTLPPVTPQGTQNVSDLTPTVVQGTASASSCIPGKIEITSPKDGQEVNGVVEVMGNANTPNFGFYKYEMKRPDETTWRTIQAGNAVVQNGAKLGDWDTSTYPPGEYQLGLVVVDNQAQPSAHCMITVRVTQVQETPSP